MAGLAQGGGKAIRSAARCLLYLQYGAMGGGGMPIGRVLLWVWSKRC